jgi:hypothetical protein
MSTQLRRKERAGVPIDKGLQSSLIQRKSEIQASKITKTDVSEDTPPTKSALPKLDSPTNASFRGAR